MFGFPVFVGVCFLSAVFLWLLYYRLVVGLSPHVGRLRWERLDRIWDAIRRSCMVSFRVEVDRDNIYVILRTSIVFYSVFWPLCSFFFRTRTWRHIVTLLFFYHPTRFCPKIQRCFLFRAVEGGHCNWVVPQTADNLSVLLSTHLCWKLSFNDSKNAASYRGNGGATFHIFYASPTRVL